MAVICAEQLGIVACNCSVKWLQKDTNTNRNQTVFKRIFLLRNPDKADDLFVVAKFLVSLVTTTPACHVRCDIGRPTRVMMAKTRQVRQAAGERSLVLHL